VTNCRKDFLHKLSTRLVRENQALAFETLNIKGMMSNRKLARHIADVAWGMFGDFCSYKLIGLVKPSWLSANGVRPVKNRYADTSIKI
jgi:IS605 OrfB family transposase